MNREWKNSCVWGYRKDFNNLHSLFSFCSLFLSLVLHLFFYINQKKTTEDDDDDFQKKKKKINNRQEKKRERETKYWNIYSLDNISWINFLFLYARVCWAIICISLLEYVSEKRVSRQRSKAQYIYFLSP